jgi:inward rectifier potassium channel
MVRHGMGRFNVRKPRKAAAMKKRRTVFGFNEIELVGVRRHVGRDLYHFLLRAPWSVDLLLLSATYLGTNLLFGLIYYFCGGIHGATTYWDSFFYSVETLGTIGYGEMYPTTHLAHAVVTVEALTEIFLIAVTTGLVFAKFSMPRARVQFATHPVIGIYDGEPMLQLRLSNERESRLIEATCRVVAFRTERTKEGVTIYRMHDVPLERDRSPALLRSWTVMHRIAAGSLFDGATPESIERDEIELIVTLTGTDELSAQMLWAQTRYVARDIVWGARYADVLSELPNGRMRLDMRMFHETVATKRSQAFPYGEA